MHRLAAVPGATGDTDGPLYVEQPSAPLLLLSSADTDLSALAGLLRDEPALLSQEVRGLNLAALDHPAVIDHYLATSLGDTRLVLVRLLGGRGHWSYGLEQLRRWANFPGRQLVVVAGTSEDENDLASLGTVDQALALACGRCLREGGAPTCAGCCSASAPCWWGSSPSRR